MVEGEGGEFGRLLEEAFERREERRKGGVFRTGMSELEASKLGEVRCRGGEERWIGVDAAPFESEVSEGGEMRKEGEEGDGGELCAAGEGEGGEGSREVEVRSEGEEDGVVEDGGIATEDGEFFEGKGRAVVAGEGRGSAVLLSLCGGEGREDRGDVSVGEYEGKGTERRKIEEVLGIPAPGR